MAALLSGFPLPLSVVYGLCPSIGSKPQWSGTNSLDCPFPWDLSSRQIERKATKSALVLCCEDCAPTLRWYKMTADDEGQWKIKSSVFFSIFCSPLHTSGAVLIIIISSTLQLCLWASFEQCFLFCARFQQAPAFLEAAAWALSQGEGMPASASIHFCFHYASFLWSFQINFNASLNFKAYKKTLVLPTLVNWDLFRNSEDAFALVLGVTISLTCIQRVPGTISLKTSGPFPSTPGGRGWGYASDITPLPHAVLDRAIPLGQSWASRPHPRARLVGASIVPRKPSRSWGGALRLKSQVTQHLCFSYARSKKKLNKGFGLCLDCKSK